jgi:hypothetical protein
MWIKKFFLDGTPLARRRRFLVVTAAAAALVEPLEALRQA